MGSVVSVDGLFEKVSIHSFQFFKDTLIESF